MTKTHKNTHPWLSLTSFLSCLIEIAPLASGVSIQEQERMDCLLAMLLCFGALSVPLSIVSHLTYIAFFSTFTNIFFPIPLYYTTWTYIAVFSTHLPMDVSRYHLPCDENHTAPRQTWSGCLRVLILSQTEWNEETASWFGSNWKQNGISLDIHSLRHW